MLFATAWLLTYLMHSSLLLGGLALIAPRFPRRFERVIETLWRAALLAPVATASMHTFWSETGRAFILPTSLGEATTNAAPGWDVAELSRRILTEPVISWVITLLIAVSAIRVFRFGMAHRTWKGTIAGRHSLDDARVHSSVARHGKQLAAHVSISDRVSTPLVVGAREICLPSRLVSQFDDDELDAVLAHEVAHLRRRDNAWLIVTTVIAHVFWFQPLAGAALRRLHTLSEYLCDDWAIRSTGNGEALARALLRVGESMKALQPPTPQSVSTMAGREALCVNRVERMLRMKARAEVCPSCVQIFVAAALCIVTFRIVPNVDLSWRADDGRLLSLALNRASAYTVNARDDGGSFSLTLLQGKVVSATVDGEPVPHDRLVQRGEKVVVAGTVGEPLQLTLQADGGFKWTSRQRTRTSN